MTLFYFLPPKYILNNTVKNGMIIIMKVAIRKEDICLKVYLMLDIKN